VDRFFSKLDLRDIKIDPVKTSFPPDAEDPSDHDHHHHHHHQPGSVPAGWREPAADPLPGPAASHHQPPPVHHAQPDPADRAGWPGRSPHVPAWANGVEESRRRGVEEQNGHAATPDSVALTAAVLLDSSTPRLLDSPDSPETFACGDVLKVSARSRPSAVAGAIAGVVREHGRAEVQAIGAGATNQAIKAVAIARDYLRETGIEAVCLPAFIDVTIENEDRTAIRLVIEPR
jgi:stage V sporulation protein S